MRTVVFNPLDHPVIFSDPVRIAPSSWIEHLPFGMMLVELIRPRLIVELGTHYGVSYCGFCQAVQCLNLPSRCVAVDTWKGDPHAGFYGPEVLADLRAHHDPRYGGFSRLLQATFDEAWDSFADDSIDLLHIDGCHTYDAVRHDYDGWLSKLSPAGVVLLHDTQVGAREFGVRRFWREIQAHHPHLEFTHGCGLGVIAPNEAPPERLAPLFGLSADDLALFRAFFHTLGQRLQLLQEGGMLASRLAVVSERQERLTSARDALQGAFDTAKGYAHQVEREHQDLQQAYRQLEEYTGQLERALRHANPIKRRLSERLRRASPSA